MVKVKVKKIKQKLLNPIYYHPIEQEVDQPINHQKIRLKEAKHLLH
jgi:hypothetical protein